jgi:23S rRNA (guanosine2251-2'-O)-methyltransferase
VGRVVYGVHPVEELLRAARDVVVVYLANEGWRTRPAALRGIAEAAARRKITVEERSREELETLAGSGGHQGVVAIAGELAYAEPDALVDAALDRGEPALLLVLDSVQDPQNLGALVRSAHVLGAHGVLIPKDRAARVTGAAVKASAGATEHLPIALCTNLVRTLEAWKARGVWIVGALADGGRDARAPWEIDLAQPVALVVGAEGTGIRPLVARACDLHVRIPMAGRVASLNVSAAGAVLLYEAARQRRAK